MAYDDKLADRIRCALGPRDDVEEKHMFLSLIHISEPTRQAEISTRLMEFTGRPLSGFIIVDAAGIRTAAQLKKWVAETVAFATSPEQRAKQKKAAAKKRAGARKQSVVRARRSTA